ncbi:MAG: glycine cleavage system protein GcvH [Acidihalobacter sp.]|jgi:glycine cleavage system H protein
MSEHPSDLKYTKSHEWVRDNGDGTCTVGITDHAQEQLGDLVFVETPEAGTRLSAGEACAVVESVKAASDVYAPLTGEVVEGNEALADTPELVNQSAHEDGWLFTMRPDDADALSALMSAEDYAAFLESEG